VAARRMWYDTVGHGHFPALVALAARRALGTGTGCSARLPGRAYLQNELSITPKPPESSHGPSSSRTIATTLC
jgi:hypothetical protein